MAETALSPSEAVYGEVSVHLKDFLGKHPVPNLVKVTKGQYRNIGVAKSVCRELYLHSIRTCPKVLAVGVKIKDSKKSSKKAIITSEQKYALPISYQGWWELLSEDGKAIRPIATIAELARIFPAKALVREPIKALVGKEGSSELAHDRARMLHAGEQLTLVGDMLVTISTGKSTLSRRMLRCFDTKGESVYLGLDQKGLFSPIAGSGNISGVHTIHSLVGRFRLPVLVRLVHGIIPMRLERNSFTGVFRLLGIYDDETAFVMPLKRDAKMVPISTREPLKFAPAFNFDEVEKSDECVHYEQRCGRMIASYLNSIHVLVNPPDIASVQKINGESITKTSELEVKKPNKGVCEEDILFEEVDDIYAYVRDGGAPPPPRPRPPNQMARVDRRVSSPSVVQTKPVSPVIREYEDIFGGGSPGNEDGKHRRSSASKRNRSPEAEHRLSDDNYWEEPIYDEIEKFQRRIQQGQRKQNMSESMEVLGNRRHSEDKYSPNSQNNKLEEVARRAPEDVGDVPVQNLRQIYKHKESDSSSDSRPNSLEKSLEDITEIDPPAPPLPPKRYELEEDMTDKPGSPPKSQSLPRPPSKLMEHDPPTKSLPRDISLGAAKQTKSSKPPPAAEPAKATEESRKLSDPNSPKVNEVKTAEPTPNLSSKISQAKPSKVMELKGIKAVESRSSKVSETKTPKVNEIKIQKDSKSPRANESKHPKVTEPKKKERKDSDSKKNEDVNLSPRAVDPILYGAAHKGKTPSVEVSAPAADPASGPRRHSHTTIASSPPRVEYGLPGRRHSAIPGATSRGTTVAVTMGAMPHGGIPIDASSLVSSSGTSVKVRSVSSPLIQTPYTRPPGSAPGTHTQRIALTPQNAHMGRRQPQYVAVARVGDDKPAPNDKSNGSVAGLKRHIQSVHL